MNTTNNDIKALTALLIVAVIAFLVGLSVNTCTLHQTDPVEIIKTEYKTDTVWQDVEVHDTVTQMAYKYVLKRDTLYKQGDSIPVILETAQTQWADTIGDSVSYRAWITGIDSKLDSISFRYNKPIVTNTITTQVEKARKKKIGDYLYYGLGVSAGYDPFNNRPAMIIGAQAGIRL